MPFLALEPLLIARIREQVAAPGLKMFAPPDLDGVLERAQHTPAIHVLRIAVRVNIESGLTTITEDYATIVAVRNVRDAVSGAANRADAGPLLDALFMALLGWLPEGCKSFEPLDPPRDLYRDGYGYYPLAWRARHRAIPVPCPTL